MDESTMAQLRKDLQDFMADRDEDQRQAAMETEPSDWRGIVKPSPLPVIIHEHPDL